MPRTQRPLLYLAYVNAGLRVNAVSDSREQFVDACYIPEDPKERKGPLRALVPEAANVVCDPQRRLTCRRRAAGSTSSTTNMTKE